MWFGRFGVIVPVLAIAGSLAAKKRLAITEGTLPTHGPLFITLLIGVVLLVGLLTHQSEIKSTNLEPSGIVRTPTDHEERWPYA